jgi:hypothetical protein
MRKSIKRFLVWVIAPVLALVIAATSLTLIVRYPNPIDALALAQSLPSEQPELMQTHKIPASTTPHIWEVAVSQETLPKTFTFQGREFNTQDLLRATATNALLIIRNGVITYEDYSDGFSKNQITNTMSMGKTLSLIHI